MTDEIENYREGRERSVEDFFDDWFVELHLLRAIGGEDDETVRDRIELDVCCVAVLDLLGDDEARQRIEDLAAYETSERASAVLRRDACSTEPVERVVVDGQLDLADALLDLSEAQLDNGSDLSRSEWIEDDLTV